MKTEYRFAEALKTMMSNLPLEEVSVAALARRCKVNRQTFYYHFRDIYDLLALVFLNEEITGADETKSSEELV
ncbi:MAG: TetR family transcriptional regulator, partial [Erysipelotrichia bacterium]|nr:TetR family transcriptional regulator [Erysipelotrichia bacterium]